MFSRRLVFHSFLLLNLHRLSVADSAGPGHVYLMGRPTNQRSLPEVVKVESVRGNLTRDMDGLLLCYNEIIPCRCSLALDYTLRSLHDR